MEYSPKLTTKQIKQYAEEMPIELRRSIEALSDEVRLGIFFVLFKYGEMSFSEIRNKLEIPTRNSSYLAYHLKKLEKGALIKNDYSKKSGVTSHSFYDVTEFGERIIEGLIKSIEIDQSIQEKLDAIGLESSVTDSAFDYDVSSSDIINPIIME